MKQFMYAVQDLKSEVFIYPFFRRSHADAIRFFGDGVRDSKTIFAVHPEDYRLFCLASFDDESGEVISVPTLMFLANATDFTSSSADARPQEVAR